MIYLWNTLIIIGSFILMELVAWTSHKYIMHGFLWYLHKDHHQPHDHKLEKNDFFALIFMLPSWLLIMFGVIGDCDYRLYMGIGFTLYGICYALIHDGLIHGRISLLNKTKNAKLLALKNGHLAHHENDTKADYKKENNVCYGMLWVPLKYFIEAKKNNKATAEN
ncbi:MAG: sterol desaturase family protein [Bacteroidetes bacterium]|nr:sterol desaturase family protein [Bacteroidota bacterium]